MRLQHMKSETNSAGSCRKVSAGAEAKVIVFEKINSEIGPMRERYEAYMQEPEKVEAILREGVERIRPMARALVDGAAMLWA